MLTLHARHASQPNFCKASNTLAADGFSPTLARLFAARGVASKKELDTALKHLLPAKDLLGLDDATNLLDQAIDEQKTILIVGDFDCDGATSTALMVRVLGNMGAVVHYLVPDRFKYGYGLTPEIVELGMSLYAPKLIVTVDNGISSHAGVAEAHSLGAQVIITDHHLTTKPKPPADAVVNPNQLGCQFPSKALAGVGVAFYLLAVLAKQRKAAGKTSTQVTPYLDLVALGTVADVAMLDTNNRILVANGLAQINAGRACHGIMALLKTAGKLTSLGMPIRPVQAQDFGFIIGPRINAAGRMDNMRIGIECLLSNTFEEALKSAEQLEALNRERKSVELQMRDDALVMLNSASKKLDVKDKKSIVLYEPSWHQGVIGIVAGRLKEQYYKPAIVFAPSDDSQTMLKGSARSIDGVHIRDTIEAVAEAHPNLISHFGGHAMAAGLTLQPQHVAQFSAAFEAAVAKHSEHVFCERIYTDGALAAQEFELDFCLKLGALLPWGNGFEAPVFDGVFTLLNAKVLKQKHLKLYLEHPNQIGVLEAIWFNYSVEKWRSADKWCNMEKRHNAEHNTKQHSPSQSKQVHVLFELSDNEYNGTHTLQLLIKDLSVIES